METTGSTVLDEEVGEAFDRLTIRDDPEIDEAFAGFAPEARATADPSQETPGALTPPPLPIGRVWHVALAERALGPMSAAAIRALWDHGDLTPDTPLWRPGMEGWKPLARVPVITWLLAPLPARPAMATIAYAPLPAREAERQPAAAAALAHRLDAPVPRDDDAIAPLDEDGIEKVGGELAPDMVAAHRAHALPLAAALAAAVLLAPGMPQQATVVPEPPAAFVADECPWTPCAVQKPHRPKAARAARVAPPQPEPPERAEPRPPRSQVDVEFEAIFGEGTATTHAAPADSADGETDPSN